MLKKLSIPAAVAAIALFSASMAFAASNLSGYAWSSNIGWISFNSTDSGAGGGPYSVSLSTSSPCSATAACLSGYAWSPNIGWVSFNPSDVTGCPSGSCSPSVNMSTGAISGWMRALSGVGRTNGWDGWMELSGTNHQTGDAQGNNGVTFVPSTGKIVGYGWGGPVVGWLSFNNNVSVCTGASCGTNNGGGSITGTCNASSYSLPSTGGSVTYSLSSLSDNGTLAYSWNSGNSGSSSSASPVFSSSTAGSYTASVVVTDSAAGTSGTISCLPVTVASPVIPTVSVPTLWVHTTPANDAACAANFAACDTTAHIHNGGSATVAFAWPSAQVCSGNVVSSPANWQPAGWLQTLVLNDGSIGTVTFSGLANGVYKVDMLCSSLQGRANFFMTILDDFIGNKAQASSYTPSNTVEVDVTPSTIQEI